MSHDLFCHKSAFQKTLLRAGPPSREFERPSLVVNIILLMVCDCIAGTSSTERPKESTPGWYVHMFASLCGHPAKSGCLSPPRRNIVIHWHGEEKLCAGWNAGW
jgi:hypothetical protein